MNVNTLDDAASFDGVGDLMCVWAKCDAWLFDPGHQMQSMIPGPRKKAERFLRMLLTHHSAKEEIGAALTLFDVLMSKAISPLPFFLSVEEVMDQASLAAIVRLVLKCSTMSLTMGPSISEVERVVGLGKLQKTGVITAREVRIFTTLAGRVAAPSLPAPKQWLDSVLRRLEFLIAPQMEQVAEFEQAVRGAEAAADLLTRSVGMSSFLPARALALGSCVLGFIIMGALSAEQARPKEVSSSLWDSVLVLWQSGHAKFSPSTLGVDLDSLAVASCCSPSDLQVW
eukprot:CAMPEP_0172658364 /NCGR_PEP_ID=MMETSP1074-20121228/2743_1 /TAXON_ID=2916 /ORGANISM="Ceratium fusus, Strain PA161109" /LENGTH=283 /DNA_ID=CAMNT_0013473657 /DNA_START=64 /DNA_END=912 /DNA_ORIENTATION=+